MNCRTPSSALRATLRLGLDTNGSSSALRLAVLAYPAGPATFRQSKSRITQRQGRPFIHAPSNTIQRCYSSQSAAAQKPEPVEQQQPSQQSPNPVPSPEDANPPSTTRPPPLDTPVRQPGMSTFKYLFSTGKAYLGFYKNGIKSIYHNTRLVYNHRVEGSSTSSSSSSIQTLVPRPGTRSHLLLRDRWNHDIRRLPIFILLFIVCGEFTPFVVVAVPSIVPYTCRIPQHVNKLTKKLEERRAHSLSDFHYAAQSSTKPEDQFPIAHLARSLGLVSSFWDRIGFVPEFVAKPRVEKRLQFLAEDSMLLVKAGGVPALEDEEVKLACCDRGIDVTDRSDEELRDVLARWLRLVTQHEGGKDESAMRVIFLLTRPETEWPFEE